MKATIYRTDGEMQEITPANGKEFQLEELQKIVGGLIEIIPCNDSNLIMILDEEGKLKNKPFNSEATELVSEIIPSWDVIVGDVLVCESSLVK